MPNLAKAREPKPVVTHPLATEVKAKSGQKVTVACKLPNGVILRLFNKIEKRVPQPGGMGTETVFVPRGDGIRIRGVAAPAGQVAPGLHTPSGYALTPNVDKDFWDEWLAANGDQEIVENNLIFAMPSIDGAKGVAKEHKDQRSGLEPLNPARKMMPDGRSVPEDPRWPKGTRAISAPAQVAGEDEE